MKKQSTMCHSERSPVFAHIPRRWLTNNTVWRRMETRPGYDLRIHVAADWAFAYRPVILEGPKVTYLIGWSQDGYAPYLKETSKDGKNMHLFVYPARDVSCATGD